MGRKWDSEAKRVDGTSPTMLLPPPSDAHVRVFDRLYSPAELSALCWKR